MPCNPASSEKQKMKGYIPIDPALLRFVEWRDLLRPNEILLLPGATATACIIQALFQSAAHLPVPEKESPITERFTERLHFLASPPFANYDVFLQVDYVSQHLNKILYHQAHAEVLRRVLIEKEYDRKKERDTVEDFLRETGLEQFWEADSVKRAQHRARSARHFTHLRKAGFSLNNDAPYLVRAS